MQYSAWFRQLRRRSMLILNARFAPFSLSFQFMTFPEWVFSCQREERSSLRWEWKVLYDRHVGCFDWEISLISEEFVVWEIDGWVLLIWYINRMRCVDWLVDGRKESQGISYYLNLYYHVLLNEIYSGLSKTRLFLFHIICKGISNVRISWIFLVIVVIHSRPSTSLYIRVYLQLQLSVIPPSSPPLPHLLFLCTLFISHTLSSVPSIVDYSSSSIFHLFDTCPVIVASQKISLLQFQNIFRRKFLSEIWSHIWI